MDKTVLKAKVKEKKDEAMGYLHRHWKGITFAGVTVGLGLIAAYMLSSKDNDEKNDIEGDEDYDNFDTDSCGDLDEVSDSQTCLPRNYPKRDIGGIDVTGSRLTENQKQFLEDLSTQYDRFKGKEQTVVDESVGISSDGKYRCTTNRKYSFPDDKIGINVNVCSKYDDGQIDEINYFINTGRDIINFTRGNKNLKMFKDEQDIVGKLFG